MSSVPQNQAEATVTSGDDILVNGTLEAAIYPRVSSAAQAEGYSLESQRSAMLDKARELGWRVRRKHVFTEMQSGEDLFERPQLTRLRAMVVRGQIQGVVFYDVDRFARDPVWIEMVTQEAFHFGAQVAFVRGGDDLSKNTPEARVLRMLKGYAAQTELSQIKERTARGRRERVDAGRLRPSSRGPLYGYDFADADMPDPGKKTVAPKVRYVIREDQAVVVRDIFARSAAGVTMRQISLALMREGVPGPTTMTWSEPMVKHILNNTAYFGEAYACQRASVKVRRGDQIVHKGQGRPREEWVRYPDGVVPPIVDRPLFESAAARRQANRRTRPPRDPADLERFLLRGGYIFCGMCEERLYIRTETAARHQRASYWCTSEAHDGGRGGRVVMRADVLDAAVWSHLVQLLDNPTFLTEEIDRMRANDPSEADLASVDRSLVKTSQTVDNLTRSLAAVKSAEARAHLGEALDAAFGQRQRLQEERQRIMGRRQGWLDAQRQVVELQAWMRALRGGLDEMPYELKREALNALGVRVVLYPNARSPRWELAASIPMDDSSDSLVCRGDFRLSWTSLDPTAGHRSVRTRRLPAMDGERS